MPSWPYGDDESKKRLLVVGCGPAGIAVLKALASEFRIAVVEPKDYYEFTPGILRGFVKPELLPNLHVELAGVTRGLEVTHVRGEVVSLQRHAARVKFADLGISGAQPRLSGAEDIVELPFDYAVVATGSKYSGSGLWKVTGAPGEEAWTSLVGRKAGLAASLSKLQNVREQHGTAIVVGAGLVGVELAAELAYYMPDLKIVLVNRGGAILPSLPESARDYARRWFGAHGVELRLGQSLPTGQEAESLGIQGPVIVFPCAGVRMRNDFMAGLNCCDAQGAILVNHSMQVLCNEPLPKAEGVVLCNEPLPNSDGEDASTSKSEAASCTDSKESGGSESEDATTVSGQDRVFGNIFAVGDCTRVEACDALPREIYPAEAAAEVVVKNLRLAKHVQNLCTCQSSLHKLGVPLNEFVNCSLGPDDGVFVANGRVMATGWAAATMKAQIESTKMGQYRQELWGSLVWSLVPHW